MRDEQPNNEQLKIELLSQWKLEAESRNYKDYCFHSSGLVCRYASSHLQVATHCRIFVVSFQLRTSEPKHIFQRYVKMLMSVLVFFKLL